MKKLIITSCTFLLLIVACKKDENTSTGSLPLTSANIEGKFKTTSALVTPAGSTIGFDVFNVDAYYAPCKRDDLHTFTAAGSYNYADSGVYCTTPPIGKTGTYTLVAPNQLTFDGRNYLVQSLTTTQLVIAFDSVVAPYGNTTFKLTLTKQP